MKALLVVDIQNDFLPGGALAVKEGDTIIASINQMMETYPLVIATQDWHPRGHESFASSHLDRNIGEVIDLHGLQQVLWPDHCVQGSEGAQFADALNTELISSVFQKGCDPMVDSYSGFFDNGARNSTGLDKYLYVKGVEEVHVVGLATDYCVKFTALDAAKSGFRTVVHAKACRGVNIQPDDSERALAEMAAAGIEIVRA